MYLARVGFKTALLEKNQWGGQAFLIDQIENYPGFPDGISGRALMNRFYRQAGRQGLVFFKEEVSGISKESGRRFLLETEHLDLACRALVLATGANFKELGIAGESQFLGKGVYYGAFEKAARFRGEDVAVVGAGDAAVHQAVHLGRFAKRVYVLCRGAGLSAAAHLKKRIGGLPNVKILYGTRAIAAEGNGALKRVRIQSEGDHPNSLNVSGLFILIGKKPDETLIGRISPQEGVFTAGDIHSGRCRQVAIASGDGMRAAMLCAEYLSGIRSHRVSPN